MKLFRLVEPLLMLMGVVQPVPSLATLIAFRLVVKTQFFLTLPCPRLPTTARADSGRRSTHCFVAAHELLPLPTGQRTEVPMMEQCAFVSPMISRFTTERLASTNVFSNFRKTLCFVPIILQPSTGHTHCKLQLELLQLLQFGTVTPHHQISVPFVPVKQ